MEDIMSSDMFKEIIEESFQESLDFLGDINANFVYGYMLGTIHVKGYEIKKRE